MLPIGATLIVRAPSCFPAMFTLAFVLTTTHNHRYVFCSAWDRANHSCPEYARTVAAGNFTWGCGGCSTANECYVGAWVSNDMWTWVGPFEAVPPTEVAKLRKPPWGDVAHHNYHPPALQLPTNVAVAPVPRASAAPIAGVRCFTTPVCERWCKYGCRNCRRVARRRNHLWTESRTIPDFHTNETSVLLLELATPRSLCSSRLQLAHTATPPGAATPGFHGV